MKFLSVFHSLYFIALMNCPLAQAATPGNFAIEELKEISKKRNFDSRIEYTKVVEAKKSSEAAYLALAPRLTLNTIATLLTPGAIQGAGFLTVAGDLVPFLFPSNWYQAEATDWQYQIEQLTLKILKLDTATQVEQLSNLILRDLKIASQYRVLASEIRNVLDEVKIREQLGQYPDGSAANVASILSALERDALAIENNTNDQFVQLAVMAGMKDVKAVKSIQWRLEKFDIEHPWIGDETSTLILARQKSLELKQAKDLIELAKTNLHKWEWSWLDPSGAYLTGIGLPYGKTIEIAETQVKELRLGKEKTELFIARDLSHVFNVYSDAISHYSMGKDALKIQNERKNIILQNFQIGARVDFFGLTQIYQDYLQTVIQIENAVAQYRNARAQLTRFLLSDSL